MPDGADEETEFRLFPDVAAARTAGYSRRSLAELATTAAESGQYGESRG